MAMDCSSIEGLLDAATAITVYRDLLDKWLHGTETEDVLLGGVLVPTLRKLVATIDERESHAAQEVVDEAVQAVVVLRNQMTELAAEVQAKLDAIGAIDAQVTETLEPDEEATVDYDPQSGLLAFGIPRGRDGAVGPAGPAGSVIAGFLDSGMPGRVVVNYIDAGEPGSRGGGPAPAPDPETPDPETPDPGTNATQDGSLSEEDA